MRLKVLGWGLRVRHLGVGELPRSPIDLNRRHALAKPFAVQDAERAPIKSVPRHTLNP